MYICYFPFAQTSYHLESNKIYINERKDLKPKLYMHHTTDDVVWKTTYKPFLKLGYVLKFWAFFSIMFLWKGYFNKRVYRFV